MVSQKRYLHMKDKSKSFNVEDVRKDSELCFAALKLIEQLYHDGHITSQEFHKILDNYADVVDMKRFIDYR